MDMALHWGLDSVVRRVHLLLSSSRQLVGHPHLKYQVTSEKYVLVVSRCTLHELIIYKDTNHELKSSSRSSFVCVEAS